MNALERKMVELLIDLKENHHAVGVKAEFEDEGTRMEEALRLKEISMRAGLALTIKIGGCGALTDTYQARAIGVSRIAAPMVETPYALRKFLAMARLVFLPDEDIELCANIETIDACKAFARMLFMPEISELKGIVMGRVDLVGSLGLTREDINGPKVYDIISELFTKAKQASLECAIGGGVSTDALPFFRRLPAGSLDRYETRKVIFKCPDALDEDADEHIMSAVQFELLWLENKRNQYLAISRQDEQRIAMLESRLRKLLSQSDRSMDDG